MAERLGISGRIALRFQSSDITPLLALVGLLLGLFAIAITPLHLDLTYQDQLERFESAFE